MPVKNKTKLVKAILNKSELERKFIAVFGNAEELNEKLERKNNLE